MSKAVDKFFNDEIKLFNYLQMIAQGIYKLYYYRSCLFRVGLPNLRHSDDVKRKNLFVAVIDLTENRGGNNVGCALVRDRDDLTAKSTD